MKLGKVSIMHKTILVYVYYSFIQYNVMLWFTTVSSEG